MNTTQDDGGPIASGMEVHSQGDSQRLFPVGGLSLRDWLAKEGAKIHAEGLLALGFQPSSRWEEICREGLAFADAMLAARKEKA